jgi:hypothetical protein
MDFKANFGFNSLLSIRDEIVLRSINTCAHFFNNGAFFICSVLSICLFLIIFNFFSKVSRSMPVNSIVNKWFTRHKGTYVLSNESQIAFDK